MATPYTPNPDTLARVIAEWHAIDKALSAPGVIPDSHLSDFQRAECDPVEVREFIAAARGLPCLYSVWQGCTAYPAGASYTGLGIIQSESEQAQLLGEYIAPGGADETLFVLECFLQESPAPVVGMVAEYIEKQYCTEGRYTPPAERPADYYPTQWRQDQGGALTYNRLLEIEQSVPAEFLLTLHNIFRDVN